MGLSGRYEILEERGQGTSGVVYRARERATGRQVAIKVLHRPEGRTDPDLAEALRREGELLTRLDHPGVVRVFEVSVDGDGACLVTELVDGPSLAAILRRRGRLTVAETLSIVAQAGRALAAAHARGIVHRDVKPANLLLAEDGRVLLADFGLAVESDTRSAGPGDGRGTPAYAAPERLRGEAGGPAADVFSLGVVLYECLTGRLPFDRPEAGDRERSAPEPPSALVDEIGAELSDLCLAALADDPAQRPAGALELARRLEALAAATGGPDPLRPGTGVAPAGPDLEPAARRTRALRPPPVSGKSRRLALAAAVSAMFLLGATIRAPAPAGPPQGIAVAPRPDPAPERPVAAPPESLSPSAPAEAPGEAKPRAPARRTGRPRRAPKPVRPRTVPAPSPSVTMPAPAPAAAAPVTAPERVPQAAQVEPAPTPAPAVAAPEPARAVVEVRHPLEAGELEVRLDGRLVARIRLGDPLLAPSGRPAIASFDVPAGRRRLAVTVRADDGATASWSTRSDWDAGSFRVERLTVERAGDGLRLVHP